MIERGDQRGGSLLLDGAVLRCNRIEVGQIEFFSALPQRCKVFRGDQGQGIADLVAWINQLLWQRDSFVGQMVELAILGEETDAAVTEEEPSDPALGPPSEEDRPATVTSVGQGSGCGHAECPS